MIYLSGSKLNVVMEALYAVLLEVKKMRYQKNMTERYLCMSALKVQPQNRFSPLLMYLLLAIYSGWHGTPRKIVLRDGRLKNS